MDESRAFLFLVNEETARLRWFEAFMRGRVELEQQTISGLQALLEGAPLLLNSKLLWHRSLEKLLDGTRDELHTRIEELERLKGQMEAVGISIANAEKSIRDINSEFKKLEQTESVDSAQAATVTLHKDWLDIKSVDVSVQKGLSDLFASKEKLEKEKSWKSSEAFAKYYNQDLKYRSIVHQQQQNQEQFLNSIPDRIQEYGTKYWPAVRDVGMVMESFADCLRNISSTCNASGAEIWASAKNIKPLVDANRHTEAIQLAYHQSPIRFSLIHYRNPGSKLHSPGGQTILFGCPLALCTVGELKKIPPVLEYLLDSIQDWPGEYGFHPKTEEYWPLANELEQAWTGVEETDRAIISTLALPMDRRFLIMVYFKALPEPVWSRDDINVAWEVSRDPSTTVWDTWNKDPTKIAVLRALVSWQARFAPVSWFGSDIVMALAVAKDWRRGIPGNIFMDLYTYHDFWRSP